MRIVCLGGGTGLSTLLRGLKTVGAQITAIVTLTDDGGSSGRLRRDLAMPPPGDIRNCLIALAEDESLMNRLFRHRFDRGELAGHAFGNLFLAALTEVVGSFDAAVAEVGRVLAVEGSVVPATTHPAALLAEMDDGRYVAGETAVARDRHGVRRLFLSPADAVANPQALAAVERADLIVLGPGSLFTSTLPPLLVPGLGRAVLKARGLRIYVCNLLQQPGETIGYRASNHVERLHQHVGARVIDSVMVPRRAITTDNIPVEFDRAAAVRSGRARDRGADRRPRRVPPRPRGARTRARARHAAQGAQRPCRSLRTSAPSSPRYCRRRSTAAWRSSPESCAMPARCTCRPAEPSRCTSTWPPRWPRAARSSCCASGAPRARSAPTASTASSARHAS